MIKPSVYILEDSQEFGNLSLKTRQTIPRLFPALPKPIANAHYHDSAVKTPPKAKNQGFD
jgi:hypothetical protein